MAIILTIVLFGVIIVLHELGHFLAAKLNKIRVNDFSIGFGPSLFSFNKGNTKYSIRVFPLGGYVAIDDEFDSQPIYKRIIVILAGSLVNILSGFLVISIILLSQGGFVSTKVASTTEQQSKIQVGDDIKSINNNQILNSNDISFELSRISDDEPINLTVLRNDELIELNDVGYFDEINGKNSKILGISLGVDMLNFSNFFKQSFNNSIFMIKLTYISMCDLVTGRASLDSVSGPVGFAKSVSENRNLNILSIVSFFPLLSIYIGLFNLLPFPALDGGRFVFLLIELIFRKKIKKEVQNYINLFGIFVLMLLFVITTLKDIFAFF